MDASFIPALKGARTQVDRAIELLTGVITLAGRSLDAGQDKDGQKNESCTVSVMQELGALYTEAIHSPWNGWLRARVFEQGSDTALM